MNNDQKNTSVKGLWWKRFFYSVTGATNDFELGPNWFASVMGTGIIANASASLPLFSDKLHSFAILIWCLASLMLVGLVVATLIFFVRGQGAWKRHFNDPMMAQFYGAPPMAMTATERSGVLRERRACGKVVLTVVLGQDELAEIARAGYAEAASTDRKGREAAVSLFLSDTVWGITQ